MGADADRAFAGLLSLRCPGRADDLLRILPEARREQLRALVEQNASISVPELKFRMRRAIAAAAAARRERIADRVGAGAESLPVALLKHLAKLR